jgi:beta-glucanase (GH16 family)
MRNIALLFLLSVLACSTKDVPCEEQIWYEDSDGNGLGTPTSNVKACEQPVGYVANSDEPSEPKTAIIPQAGYTTPKSYDGMKLIFAEEFEGEALDDKIWNVQTGDGCPDLCGWGNQELQYYKKENISFKEGNLVITAKKENSVGRDYSSSRINTQGKFAFTYGRVDVRATTPIGKGMWPAIWMLGENINEVGWPKCGEIDIMEMVGGEETKVYGTVHWDNAGNYANYGGKLENIPNPLHNAFHVFSITWDEQFIRWYLDDKEFHVIDITPIELNEFKKDFHLLINLAVGGLFSGNPDGSTQFPQYYVVDYVRVFQKTN